MRTSLASAIAFVAATAAIGCATPPPAAEPEPATPTVATEPPATASPAAVAEPEPSCPAGQEPTDEGCAPTKTAACQPLIDAINEEQKPLKDMSGGDPDALRRLASHLDGVGGRIGRLPQTDPMLVGFRDDYAEMVTDLAAAARETADAIDASDGPRAKESAKEMATFGPRERGIVDEINRYCHDLVAPTAAAPTAAGPATPGPAPVATAKGPFPASTHPAMTNPKLAQGKAPPHFAVRFDTTVGTFTVKCDRSWAPHGADRFFNLVSIGYFDDVAFFRAVKGFVAQFGIHGDPAVNEVWRKANVTPDVVKASNDEGTLVFAQAGRPAAPGKTADSRSVQLFFNLTDNTRLDAMGFAPLCKVTSGLEVVKGIDTTHGEQAGRDQSNIQAQGNPYLRRSYPKLDYIQTARVVRP